MNRIGLLTQTLCQTIMSDTTGSNAARPKRLNIDQFQSNVIGDSAVSEDEGCCVLADFQIVIASTRR